MSSSAHLNFDKGEEVSLDDWEPFADEHGLTFNPHVVGRNVYRRGAIEVTFGEMQRSEEPDLPDGRIDFDAIRPPAEAARIWFSTYFMASGCRDVARLALAAWQRFGGSLDAAPEIKAHIVIGEPESDDE
jgi:hypothetical protein